jgi:hypothetical protein
MKRAPNTVLTSVGSGYSLRVRPGSVDVDVFQVGGDEARRLRSSGDLVAAVRSLDECLALSRGAALLGIPGPWAAAERLRLDGLRLAVSRSGQI